VDTATNTLVRLRSVMPVFEFRCESCEQTIEVILLNAEPAPKKCECGGKLKRLWSRVGTQFVGWGFSKNDRLVADDGKRRDFKQIRDKASELFD
jgi:putative FmdB family regulatory protein